MILLRTTRVDARIEALADGLERAARMRVALLIDERDGRIFPTDRPKVSLTAPACAAIGLHMPKDFAWRCGDYGFYLARAQFPETTHFWMIEDDVRISGDAARFFATWQALPNVDLLAAHVEPAELNWWWRATVTSADVAPRRCFFPVVRLSARAIDLLASKRRQHSRRALRRALWPNDESFVATAAAAGGMVAADFNEFGERFYDDADFSYTTIIDGRDLPTDDALPRLHHPVLFGDAVARKRERLRLDGIRSRPLTMRAYRKAIALINGMTAW